MSSIGLEAALKGGLQGVTLPAGAVSPTGLELPADLTRDQWRSIGDSLARHGSAYQWWIGDWLLSGDPRYGQIYEEAEAITGLKYQTLANLKYVAGIGLYLPFELKVAA